MMRLLMNLELNSPLCKYLSVGIAVLYVNYSLELYNYLLIIS